MESKDDALVKMATPDYLSDYLAYFRFSGDLVEGGLLDARKSAQALVGIDDAVSQYVRILAPELQEVELELPVRIRHGSWEALIPQTIGEWLAAGAAAGATSYVVAAAKKLAENDIGDKSIRDLYKSALEGIQWFIRLGTHLRDLGRRQFDDARVDSENLLIGVPNEAGDMIWVPKYHFEAFLQTSPRLLENIAQIVEADRLLSVGVNDGTEVQEITLPAEYRAVFTGEEEEDEELFPELEHGMHVELEGRVTRGNGESNTIGFKYKDHFLTCIPSSGSVIRYKPVLFTQARIIGMVTRADDKGGISDKRPKIFFSDLYTSKPGQRRLFPENREPAAGGDG